MPETRACGFVLARPAAGGHLYLTLRSARHGDVGLPKGHADEGESDLATALRETEEETGLCAGDLAVHEHFRRENAYAVAGTPKRVVYFAATTARAGLALSDEHAHAAWLGLDDACAALRHESLRAIVRDAAAYLKDPALRGTLAPADARAFLEARAGADAPVVAHSAAVAAMARAIAEAWGELDADHVEASAWVHDAGRAVAHDERHTIEGFRMLVDAGHPALAPACLSHYLKGQPPEGLVDGAFAAELRAACDLATFPPEERAVALADALAAGARRVPIDRRYDDLEARYGASAFLASGRRAVHELKRAFEERTGRALYPLLGIAG